MTPQVLLVFVCLALGLLLQRSGRFPFPAARTLNSFVIWVSVPALVLLEVPALLARTSVGWGLLVPVSMAWLQISLALLVLGGWARFRRCPKGHAGALILTAGFANTAFVGLPLLDSLLGQRSIAVGLLVDQPGSFLCISTLGILIAAAYSPREARPSAASIAKGVLGFPPFVALAAALVLWKSGISLPKSASEVLSRLSITLVPVALVAVGLQLRVSREVLARQWRAMTLGLGFKLVLSPLFFLGLYTYVFGQRDFVTRVTILEAAMAPMIMAAVVADEFELDRDTANLMVGVGIPLSLLTVPLWNALLNWLSLGS